MSQAPALYVMDEESDDEIFITIPRPEPPLYDTTIRVFDKEILASSKILKNNSEFFEREIPDACNGLNGKGEIQFLFITHKPFGSDNWYLTARHHDFKHVAVAVSEKEKTERDAFEKIIFQMHGKKDQNGKSYILTSCEELAITTSVAEQYKCLSTVNKWLISFLKKDSAIKASIRDNAIMCLILGNKLNNQDLYRTALIYVVSKWHSKSKDLLEPANHELRQIVQQEYTTLVAKVNFCLLKVITHFAFTMTARWVTNLPTNRPTNSLDRALYDVLLFLKMNRGSSADIEKRHFELVMELKRASDARLTMREYAVSGAIQEILADFMPRDMRHGEQDGFFCVCVLPEDLPWKRLSYLQENGIRSVLLGLMEDDS